MRRHSLRCSRARRAHGRLRAPSEPRLLRSGGFPLPVFAPGLLFSVPFPLLP
jgi:hypothetical protein